MSADGTALRWISRAAIGIGSAYALVCVIARGSYRPFVYPGAYDRRAESPRPADVERLQLTTADGQRASAIWLARPAAQRLVVYFHGNGNVADDLVPLGRDLVQRDLAVLLVEYRGYGASAGAKPSEEGIYLDAEAALEEARRRGFPAERVVLWGSSLGTGVAAEMAARGHGARLVLVSPFTSLLEVARLKAPWWLPVTLVLPDRYDTLDKSKAIRIPTLVVHGDKDDLIPVEMGRAVARMLPSARFMPVPGAGHNDVYDVGGPGLMDALVEHCSE